MFDIENFDKLPVTAQVIVLLIAGIVVGLGIYRSIRTATSESTANGKSPIILAFELADSRLRSDLEQIIASLRQSMVDGLGRIERDSREAIDEVAAKDSKARADLYERMRQLEITVVRIEARMDNPPGRR